MKGVEIGFRKFCILPFLQSRAKSASIRLLLTARVTQSTLLPKLIVFLSYASQSSGRTGRSAPIGVVDAYWPDHEAAVAGVQRARVERVSLLVPRLQKSLLAQCGQTEASSCHSEECECDLHMGACELEQPNTVRLDPFGGEEPRPPRHPPDHAASQGCYKCGKPGHPPSNCPRDGDNPVLSNNPPPPPQTAGRNRTNQTGLNPPLFKPIRPHPAPCDPAVNRPCCQPPPKDIPVNRDPRERDLAEYLRAKKAEARRRQRSAKAAKGPELLFVHARSEILACQIPASQDGHIETDFEEVDKTLSKPKLPWDGMDLLFACSEGVGWSLELAAQEREEAESRGNRLKEQEEKRRAKLDAAKERRKERDRARGKANRSVRQALQNASGSRQRAAKEEETGEARPGHRQGVGLLDLACAAPGFKGEKSGAFKAKKLRLQELE
jgi:hypothetical protein